MGWIDQVPRAGNLYIGGFYALYQTTLVESANITHVLSVINPSLLDMELLSSFKHYMIEVEDDPNENLLQYFEDSNRFVREGLEQGGGVFVHCAMGKSRSATLVIAYLMAEHHLAPSQALAQLCESRPVCDPNSGFMEQLEVYHRMLHAQTSGEKETIYKTWVKERFEGSSWEWEKRAKL
ncbi:phosphatases II [Lepidopterella palustris CBS 459.81]|uniref:protein-tyrosine-phosphatase n=1 Tax=Lepidopterella palustris CBS 459.81 TaxID=1314670 RepID=A0A8E2DYL7_9PEZI|nr:phosphatases II [Lepidopterella palustris CBS 459.81]